MKLPAGRYVVSGPVIAVVLVAVAGGLFLLGPLSEERVRRLDDKRVADLGEIARALDLYWTRHGRLPASLDELLGEPGVSVHSQDPMTALPYEYRVLDGKSYELCAGFVRDSARRLEGPGKNFWSHGLGRQCFQIEARDVHP